MATEEIPGAPAAPPPEQAPPAATKSEEEIIATAVAAMEKAEKEGGEPEVELRDTEETPAAPAAPAAPESPEAVKHAERLAEIARRDRLVRQEKQRLQQEREQHQAELAKARAYDQREAELKEAFKSDPLGQLQKFGVDILKLLGSQGEDEAPLGPQELQKLVDQKVSEKLDAFRAEQQKQREAAEQAQLQADILKRELGRIHSVVSEDPEKYEAIIDRGREGLDGVFAFLTTVYQEQVDQGFNPGPPTAADIAEAARIVEKVYRDQELEELRQKAERKRFAGRLTLGEPQSANEVPAKVTAASPSSKPTGTTTLNNDLQATAPQKRQLLTEEERLAAAMAITPPSEKSES